MTDTFALEIAKRTVWMEARSEGDVGMRAVAHVLVNRMKDGRWGPNLATVCLAPLQFSSWNSKDPNRMAMARLRDDDPLLVKIGTMFDAAMNGEPDPTGGACHYYATSIPAPSWVSSDGAVLTAQIGRQLFYKGVA